MASISPCHVGSFFRDDAIGALGDDLAILNDDAAEDATGTLDQGGLFGQRDRPSHEISVVVSHFQSSSVE